jgi:hypothetical protein
LGEWKAPKPKKQPNAAKKRKASDLALDGYDSDGNDLMSGAPPPSVLDAVTNGETPDQDDTQKDDAPKAPVRERLDGRPVRATREPVRFEEMPEAPKRKKRFKYKGEIGGDPRFRKKLKDTEAELRETILELNASKATCDDLQMQLEEVEQAGTGESGRISQLQTQLNDAEAKHKAELQRVKDDYEKQMETLRVRLKELEEKNP